MNQSKTAAGAARRLDFAAQIIYRDDTLLAINKPVGIASLAERNQPGTGLLEVARAYDPALMLCHRLDKMTSGVLLFARSPEAYRNIALQFQRRQVDKSYLTLVRGTLHWAAHEVALPLTPLQKGIVHVNLNEGKPALTYFTTERIFSAGYTLLRCTPITGRSHQIRVHLAYSKVPVVGDVLYGGAGLYLSSLKRKYRPSEEAEERPLNDGYLLHAERLVCTHPATGEQLVLTAPLPKNFSVCIGVLEKYSR